MTSLRVSRDGGKSMKYGRLLTVMGGFAMAVVIFRQYTTSSQSENTTTALARKYAESYQLGIFDSNVLVNSSHCGL